MKPTNDQCHILSFLIYPETFHQLLGETRMQKGTLRSDLMDLISHGFIEVYEADRETLVSPFYDTDNMGLFAYKATKQGLKVIEQHAV